MNCIRVGAARQETSISITRSLLGNIGEEASRVKNEPSPLWRLAAAGIFLIALVPIILMLFRLAAR